MDGSSSGYKYDVFLSYSRSGEWATFIDKFFKRMLEHWLGEELGRTPKIYIDRAKVHVGQNWPEELERALQASRVMVALWSRQYFSSEWCRRELSFMLARAKEFRTQDIFNEIILPVRIHDGDSFPPFLSDLQYLDLLEYADPFMSERGPLCEKLSTKMRELSRGTALAIEAVTNDSFQWKVDYVNQLAMFPETKERQNRPPSLGGVA